MTAESTTVDRSMAALTDRIAGIVDRRRWGRVWVAALAVALAGTGLLAVSIAWLLIRGVGVWGIDNRVAWGFAIVNFVWWIGIGHAGTLISAILLLMRQRWRDAVNRLAEAMTLFAIACAGLFPLLHLGRPDLFYWLFPYPSTLGVWPQWRSSLVWDVYAIATYGIVSVLFFALGLVPDLAALRDRARSRFGRGLLALLAMGWTGATHDWARLRVAYVLLAGLATPLVVSVHSVVSTDFAIALQPGWHSTLHPPFFVAGAIHSGLAAVLVLVVPFRVIFGVKDLIGARHLDVLGKLMLATGCMVGYGYAVEFYLGWYSGEPTELAVLRGRLAGPRAPEFWAQVFGNVVAVQVLWWRRARRSAPVAFALGCLVLIGMWLERFTIVIQSMEHGFLPSGDGTFGATFWDWALLAGSLGLFALLFLLFVRLLPSVSMHELRESADEGEPSAPRSPVATPEVGRDAWSVVGEFASRDAIVHAARRLRDAGYAAVEGYTPMPVDALDSLLVARRPMLARWTLVGGVVGLFAAWALQFWTAVVDYPIRVAGKPLNSWPAFVPTMFELAILGAALATVAGLFVAGRFPRPYHPLFGLDGFERASRDRFFLAVRTSDARFDPVATPKLLAALDAVRVAEVRR